jgi:hypothetical protein
LKRDSTILITVVCIGMLILTTCSENLSGKSDSRDVRPIIGPLKVHLSNPRYLTDRSGKAILLSGFEFWDVLLLNGQPAREAITWSDFLAVSQKHGTNFIRLWLWNELVRFRHKPDAPWYTSKEIWLRTGPGIALDGKPKFDLTKFNQAYFDELRDRIIQAGEKGFYVSIMLFEGWSLRYMEAPWRWDGHPFNINNNIQGINGDPNGDSLGTEIHTLQIPEVTYYQEQYIKKVIDTVNDLDNVMYEISNEDHLGSTDWQYHMINYIKSYEKHQKFIQHLVWMSVQNEKSMPDFKYNEVLLNSPADCISPNPAGGYKDDPPAADVQKVIISDSDHLCGCILDRSWVWKSFTRGLNIVNYMELPELVDTDPVHVSARNAMGHVLRYAGKINLASMNPGTDLSSTTYYLANPGKEYLVYQPKSGKSSITKLINRFFTKLRIYRKSESNKSFTVNLISGTYNYEWFNPGSGTIVSTGSFATDGGNQSFTPPFSGDAVLYIYR